MDTKVSCSIGVPWNGRIYACHLPDAHLGFHSTQIAYTRYRWIDLQNMPKSWSWVTQETFFKFWCQVQNDLEDEGGLV